MSTVPNEHTSATDVEHDDEGCTTCNPEPTFEPPACPTWCTGEHVGDDPAMELGIRECRSTPAYVPDYKRTAHGVDALRTFDRFSGRMLRDEGVVSLDDLEFTPKQARLLADLLVRAADLVDGSGRQCLGAPAHFEADCGRPGPHGPHPMR